MRLEAADEAAVLDELRVRTCFTICIKCNARHRPRSSGSFCGFVNIMKIVNDQWNLDVEVRLKETRTNLVM